MSATVAAASSGHVPFPTIMVRRIGQEVGCCEGLSLRRRDDVVWGGRKRSGVERGRSTFITCKLLIMQNR